MSISKFLLDLSSRLKPVLVKVIPVNYLKKMKQNLIDKNWANIQNFDRQPFQRELYPDGINLIGNIRGEYGLGQSCRLVAKALEQADIPVCFYEFREELAFPVGDTAYKNKLSDELKYNINLLHINADFFGTAFAKLPKNTWQGRYNIAFWLWELQEFPDEWLRALPLLDEIWTPSEFVSNSIRKKVNIPVKTMPYFVEAPYDNRYDRKYFGLPEDKFLFLAMYSADSITERKNPKAALKAFQRAFRKEDDRVGLVLKMNKIVEDDSSIKREIEELLPGYKNIYLIDENLRKIQVNSLIRDVDVLMSLHRAEGFGLVMAEGMLLDTPVIATNWSANTEFMNPDVACMIDYELVQLHEDIGPYKAGNYWAEPNINTAAEYMKKLLENSNYYSNLQKDAFNYAEEKLGADQAVELLKKNIKSILQ